MVGGVVIFPKSSHRSLHRRLDGNVLLKFKKAIDESIAPFM
ncbi:hypothetical protein BLGI_3849 [Brevibacillus laterosporus GI-9]|nr:hypothetical protein BLGI_3849 [Brevibacillus laterosporus GI-9]